MTLTIRKRRIFPSSVRAGQRLGLCLCLCLAAASLLLSSCGDHWYIGGFGPGSDPGPAKGGGNQPPAKEPDYYVVGRYYCKYVNDGSDGGGCDVYTRSTKSCMEALNQQPAVTPPQGDICQTYCPNTLGGRRRYDPTKPVEWIQGGDCRGTRP